jgi:hypothetical protein
LLSSTPGSDIIEIPAGATTGFFTIYNKGGSRRSSSAFKVWHAPVISGTDRTMQKVGGSLGIRGEHFASDAARNIVRFGNIQAEVLQASESLLTVKVPVGAQTGILQVITPGGSASTSFEVIPAPVLTEIYPAKATVGTIVELRGSHFLTLAMQDTIRFAGVEATVIHATTTAIQVRVPRGAQTGKVVVAGAGGVAEKEFEVQQLTPQEAVQVYPNPTRGNITIDFLKADFDVHAVEVFDVTGKLVAANTINLVHSWKQEINLAANKQGVYLVVLYTGQGKVVKKVILL